MVARERCTGATYGARCLRKGPSDQWIVGRVIEKLGDGGLAEVVLWVKSDGEPAIKALQEAIRLKRKQGTVLSSPVRDPQCNGVAERAVK